METKPNNEETIPCELCSKPIPLNEYTSHTLCHQLTNANGNNKQHNQSKNENNTEIKKPDANESKKDKNESIVKNDEHKSKESESENKESLMYITNFKNNSLLDRAYGLCIGASIGDSIGSYCEFSNYAINKTALNIAMEMPGGGTWGNNVCPGQVTDDTELAVSLCYGLCNMKPNIFDIQYIAIEYEKWNKSNPFDKGFCTREVLYYAPNVTDMKRKAMNYNIEKAKQYNSEGNLANGALMRCMPLILYGYNLNYDNLYLLMKYDAELTHSNQYIYLVNTCYAIIVLYLLKCKENEKNKNKNAYNEMIKWLKQQSKKGINEATIILNEWLEDIKNIKKLHPTTKFKGFVKIAFQRVCYHLRNNSSYYEAIKSVVGEGGDSDTNACIVGGVVGVLNGLTGIPNKYIDKIHMCNPLRNERHIFQPKWYFKNKMIEKLLQNAPTNDNFIKNVVKYSID